MKRLLIFMTALSISSVPLAAKGGAAPPRPAETGALSSAPVVRALDAPAAYDRVGVVLGGKGAGTTERVTKGGPTCVNQFISCGETVSSLLETSDCALDDGTFADFFLFEGNDGDEVLINLMSVDFDTFLFLLDPVPEAVAVDDDGGVGTDSRISHTLDETGTWAIVANNFAPVSGDPGDYTLTLECTPASATSPAAPTNLTATTLSSTEVDLTWQDNANNEDDFEIQLSEDGGGFQSIGTVPANSDGANVSGLLPSTPYTFRVRARNAAGNSDWSTASAITGDPDQCFPTATAMCLGNGRFKVEVDWNDFVGNHGVGSVVPVGADDSGLFWFFNADNWEMLIKVLDGCLINDRFWVFAAATTNVEYVLRVTDTETGVVRQYFNPLGQASDAITDTSAFSTCP